MGPRSYRKMMCLPASPPAPALRLGLGLFVLLCLGIGQAMEKKVIRSKVGEKASLPCCHQIPSSESLHTYRVYWQKNITEVVLAYSEGNMISKPERYQNRTEMDPWNLTLWISPMEILDNGSYQCIVQHNSVVVCDQSVILIVTEKTNDCVVPPVPPPYNVITASIIIIITFILATTLAARYFSRHVCSHCCKHQDSVEDGVKEYTKAPTSSKETAETSSVLHAVHPALETPLLVQRCLLHGPFGSLQGGPAGKKKLLTTTADNTTSCEGMQTPTHATEAVAGIPAERTLLQKDVTSGTPGQDFRNLWLDGASGLQSPSREPMPTYPFSNTELPFGRPQILTCNLVSLCLHVGSPGLEGISLQDANIGQDSSDPGDILAYYLVHIQKLLEKIGGLKSHAVPSPFYCFPIVPSVMGTSEYSYRGVFDREKEVSCSFSLCLFQHKPPASCRLTTLSQHSLSTLLISNTVLPYNHTAIAPCQPHHSSASCTSMFSLSLSRALYFCTASHRRVCLLHCVKPFYITTDSSNTFNNFSQRKPKISLINMSSISPRNKEVQGTKFSKKLRKKWLLILSVAGSLCFPWLISSASHQIPPNRNRDRAMTQLNVIRAAVQIRVLDIGWGCNSKKKEDKKEEDKMSLCKHNDKNSTQKSCLDVIPFSRTKKFPTKKGNRNSDLLLWGNSDGPPHPSEYRPFYSNSSTTHRLLLRNPNHAFFRVFPYNSQLLHTDCQIPQIFVGTKWNSSSQALCAVISIPDQCFQQNTFSQDTTAFTDNFHDPLTEGFYKQDQNASYNRDLEKTHSLRSRLLFSCRVSPAKLYIASRRPPAGTLKEEAEKSPVTQGTHNSNNNNARCVQQSQLTQMLLQTRCRPPGPAGPKQKASAMATETDPHHTVTMVSALKHCTKFLLLQKNCQSFSCIIEESMKVMHQLLPLPHISISHTKYCSKCLEDELITTKLPNVFSSASVSLLQIKAHSRQTTGQSQWNKKQNPREQKLFKPKGCGYLLMLFCYEPDSQTEAHKVTALLPPAAAKLLMVVLSRYADRPVLTTLQRNSVEQQIASFRTFSKGLVKKGCSDCRGDTWWKMTRLHVKSKEIRENPKKSKKCTETPKEENQGSRTLSALVLEKAPKEMKQKQKAAVKKGKNSVQVKPSSCSCLINQTRVKATPGAAINHQSCGHCWHRKLLAPGAEGQGKAQAQGSSAPSSIRKYSLEYGGKSCNPPAPAPAVADETPETSTVCRLLRGHRGHVTGHGTDGPWHWHPNPDQVSPLRRKSCSQPPTGKLSINSSLECQLVFLILLLKDIWASSLRTVLESSKGEGRKTRNYFIIMSSQELSLGSDVPRNHQSEAR
ncbi:hypothetical protein IHE44_0005952 [Lamprotornis superbus]|uniref:Ig-like domain-containing protein n=1 Tax=Lamprotornis superbus TaxID=245042 RepID=A0A835TXF0_9PASS|nr:hypothetical protein IHE44_0005952 [Lamprotornis superbus]